MKEKELEFNRIVKANKAAIFTVCYLFSKDQDEVNDLFQETLINLWRGFEGFQGKCDVKTWIWRHHHLSQRRKNNRQKHLSLQRIIE
ncbi:MAG: hypothetical protein J6Y24_08440 [Bacteroidales bacterium]|nr:hypothetical protein [Bacteroidales bacterium]